VVSTPQAPKGAIPVRGAKLKQMVSVEGHFEFSITPDPVVAGNAADAGQGGSGVGGMIRASMRGAEAKAEQSREYLLRANAFVDMKDWLEALRKVAAQRSHGERRVQGLGFRV
jgi:hypothetical protein